jgi:hypothetical protein
MSERTLTLETPFAGTVTATTAYDPATGRYALLLTGNDQVRGALSVAPGIWEDDEHDSHTAAALHPALHIGPDANAAADGAGLLIFGTPQTELCPPEVSAAGSLDEFLRFTEDGEQLYGLGAEPHRSVYLLLVRALAEAVAHDPRLAQIRAAWAARHRQLAAERVDQALTALADNVQDMRRLEQALRSRLADPFPTPSDEH